MEEESSATTRPRPLAGHRLHSRDAPTEASVSMDPWCYEGDGHRNRVLSPRERARRPSDLP